MHVSMTLRITDTAIENFFRKCIKQVRSMNMAQKMMICLCICLVASSVFAETGNLGENGKKGLSPEQLSALDAGKVVFSSKDKPAGEKNALIEAAIVFDKSPEEVFNILYHTEDQVKYLDEIKNIKIIKKEEAEDHLEFLLKVAWIDIVYRTRHYFDKDRYYIHWELDKGFNNDLNDLAGFWDLYPFGDGKTLVRYGSNVSIKNVPSFIESMFKKSGVKKSLERVRAWVNQCRDYK